MSRNIAAGLILIVATLHAWAAPQNAVREAITRAEALYYQAEFARAIEVLLPIDNRVGDSTDPLVDKIRVKLHLALAYVGLNENGLAKSYFRAMFALDPRHLLDPLEFSPKVLQLAEEARGEQSEIECRRLLDGARTELAAGNAGPVLQLLDRNHAKCPTLGAIARETSEFLFKNGIEMYRKSQLDDALDAFRTALRLDPENELAGHYIELAQNKQALDADRVFLAWRRNFDVGAYLLAANEYRNLLANASKETLNLIHADYRRALSILVESHERACARNDAAAVERVNRQASEMLPDPSIAPDLLQDFGPCRNTNCIEVAAALALVRLKSRVDPEIPPQVRLSPGSEPIMVRVKMRISETGAVMSSEPSGDNVAMNDAVGKAVRQWKFSPAIVGAEARCVDTEIPIAITREGLR